MRRNAPASSGGSLELKAYEVGIEKETTSNRLHRELHSERGTRSEGRNRRGCPAARGTPRALKTAESAGLLDREIEDLAQNSPLVPQADLGEAVPAHEELFLRFELFESSTNGTAPKVCRLQKRPAHFSNT